MITVHDVGSTKQHVRRGRERVKQEDERGAALSCCRGRGQRTGNTRWVCGRCRAALTAGLRWPSSSPLQVKCCCCWAALYPLDFCVCLVFFLNFLPFPPPHPSSWSSSSSAASQVAVPTLVLVDDVPAAAQLFPHVGHLLAKGGVLPLQEGGAHRDLVLLQPPGVARALGRLVVLDPPAPVLLILSSAVYVGGCVGRKAGVGGRNKRGEWNERGQLCDERGESGKSKEEGKITAEQSELQRAEHRFVLDCKRCVTRRPVSHPDQLETSLPNPLAQSIWTRVTRTCHETTELRKAMFAV